MVSRVLKGLRVRFDSISTFVVKALGPVGFALAEMIRLTLPSIRLHTIWGSSAERPGCAQAYLEDFYNFCQKVGGSTAEVMAEILEVRDQAHSRHTAWFLHGRPRVEASRSSMWHALKMRISAMRSRQRS